MREFVIEKNDSDRRLDSFLQKAVPLLPKNLMYKYLRLKRIKLNGKRAEISTRLNEKDIVSLYINDEFFDNDTTLEFLLAPSSINVVFEDQNILLCDKPQGLSVHADNDGGADNLINRVLHYLYDKKEYIPENELSFIPSLCNRIDRNTGGIVIVAKNAEALRVMNEKIKNRELRKFYLCVVDGVLSPPSGRLTHYIKRIEGSSLVTVYDSPGEGAKTAVSSYKTLKIGQSCSLLEVELHTGRTHQIRSQLSFIHHPIIGDGKYGIGELNRRYGVRRQLLYSYKLKFEFSGEPTLLDYLNGKEFAVKSVAFATDNRFFTS